MQRKKEINGGDAAVFFSVNEEIALQRGNSTLTRK